MQTYRKQPSHRLLIIMQMACVNVCCVPPPFSSLQPCSNQMTMHYSFDMAQQVHYPSDPLQPGPIYFVTPRKCALFGVCCEAIPRQINYLIDEAMDVGKGSNAIVNMLHHFFETHGLGEVHVHLHADNCVGQNKNNTIIQYLCWRVLCGLHRTVTLSFMVVGHTKFSPDWCFGLLKQRYRRSRVGCLDDVVKVVEESATCNTAQLVWTQDSQTVVTTYDRAAMLGRRHEAEGVETTLDLGLDPDWAPSSRVLPHVLPPSGLSFERRTYLYEKIREFVPEELRDVVCHRPEHTTTTTITPGLPEEEEYQPPVKRGPVSVASAGNLGTLQGHALLHAPTELPLHTLLAHPSATPNHPPLPCLTLTILPFFFFSTGSFKSPGLEEAKLLSKPVTSTKGPTIDLLFTSIRRRLLIMYEKSPRF